jgi:tetratricopeptide (TPR) repeat protein
MERQEFDEAAGCFETAHRMEPRVVGPMVNASIAYSNLGRNDEAEKCLRRALKAEPANAAANFNLGLLLGETGRIDEAERALRAALKADPQMAPAACNLGVMLAQKNLDEALVWCRKAHEIQPANAKYAQTLAFYLRQKGDLKGAAEVYRKTLAQPSLSPDEKKALRAEMEGLGAKE